MFGQNTGKYGDRRDVPDFRRLKNQYNIPSVAGFGFRSGRSVQQSDGNHTSVEVYISVNSTLKD